MSHKNNKQSMFDQDFNFVAYTFDFLIFYLLTILL
jgi:hypothetical protein